MWCGRSNRGAFARGPSSGGPSRGTYTRATRVWTAICSFGRATCSPTLLQSGSENRARCPVKSALLELRGGHVAERAVRPNRIVVQAPGFDDLACVSQAEEPVLVETLVAEPAVETLDVGILIRLARLDEVQPDALGVGPCIEGPADELGSIVRDEHRRARARLDEPLEHLDHSPAADRRVHFDRQTGPREVIHHRQKPDAAAVFQGVQQEVERPALVDPRRPRQRRPAGDAAPAAPSAYREAVVAIQAVDPLEIQAIALPSEQDIEPAIAKAAALGRQGVDSRRAGHSARRVS